MNKELLNIEIDLSVAKNGQLDESFLTMFGWSIQAILSRIMAGMDLSNVKIRGTRNEVSTFARTLERERTYLESLRKHNLNSPQLYNNKYELEKAVKQFEKETGLIWPFK